MDYFAWNCKYSVLISSCLCFQVRKGNKHKHYVQDMLCVSLLFQILRINLYLYTYICIYTSFDNHSITALDKAAHLVTLC